MSEHCPNLPSVCTSAPAPAKKRVLGGSRRAEQRLPRRAKAGRGVPVSDERVAWVTTLLPFALRLRLPPLFLERMHKPL